MDIYIYSSSLLSSDSRVVSEIINYKINTASKKCIHNISLLITVVKVDTIAKEQTSFRLKNENY